MMVSSREEAVALLLGDHDPPQARDLRSVDYPARVTTIGLTVDSVTCPANQTVSQGASFQCDVSVSGQPQKVTITVSNNEGAYQVGRPA